MTPRTSRAQTSITNERFESKSAAAGIRRRQYMMHPVRVDSEHSSIIEVISILPTQVGVIPVVNT